MADRLFDIDPATKLGNADWGEADDFSSFVDALNRGVTVRPDGLPGVSELPRENELDEASLLQLKSLLSGYR